MLSECRRFVAGAASLTLISLAASFSQNAPNAAAPKPDLIAVQVKVSDKKNAAAIENADVQIKWGHEESDSASATTNSKGIARFTDIPRGIAVIRVIATGYEVAAPKIEFKQADQLVKIELEKETHAHSDSDGPSGK